VLGDDGCWGGIGQEVGVGVRLEVRSGCRFEWGSRCGSSGVSKGMARQQAG